MIARLPTNFFTGQQGGDESILPHFASLRTSSGEAVLWLECQHEEEDLSAAVIDLGRLARFRYAGKTFLRLSAVETVAKFSACPAHAGQFPRAAIFSPGPPFLKAAPQSITNPSISRQTCTGLTSSATAGLAGLPARRSQPILSPAYYRTSPRNGRRTASASWNRPWPAQQIQLTLSTTPHVDPITLIGQRHFSNWVR